jgi:hypothetical protein
VSQVFKGGPCIARFKIAECDAAPRTFTVALKIEEKNGKAVPMQQSCPV